MTVLFVLSGGTIIALCEKVISYKELISLTPLSAFGIRLNINLKYICAYSVQQVLLMNGGIYNTFSFCSTRQYALHCFSTRDPYFGTDNRPL